MHLRSNIVAYRKTNYMDDKVNEISDALNTPCFDAEEFCFYFTQENRDIQQNLTRLAVQWLKTCSSVSYSYDIRNRTSHEVAKDIMKHEPEKGWIV